MRPLLLAHIAASYCAGPAFMALEVFYYRPIHWSPMDARLSALGIAAFSPLTAPLLLVGTPIGIAVHHGPFRPLWLCVGAAYLALEFALYRCFKRSNPRKADITP